MSDELVEAVARALAKSWLGKVDETSVTEVMPDARAAIAVVIERCAKVAEKHNARRFREDGKEVDPRYLIASAIRKLGESE